MSDKLTGWFQPADTDRGSWMMEQVTELRELIVHVKLQYLKLIQVRLAPFFCRGGFFLFLVEHSPSFLLAEQCSSDQYSRSVVEIHCSIFVPTP